MSYLILCPFYGHYAHLSLFSLTSFSLFSGIMKPGLNAIMGPTGSGKTRYVTNEHEWNNS